QAAREDRHVEMRRLRISVRSRHWSGLDGGDAESAIVVGGYAAEAGESRIERLVLRILGMRVAAVCVGLPDLDDGIVHRPAVTIQHAPFDDVPLAGATRDRHVAVAQ